MFRWDGKHVNKPQLPLEERTGLELRVRGRGAPGAVWVQGVLESRTPSVNLKESKVGEEGGSLKMSPGQSTDPKGRPGL